MWSWLRGLLGPPSAGAREPRPPRAEPQIGDQEGRILDAFCRHYGLRFGRPELLKLALTHRSYLHVTGRGPRESNERLEFLGDSVLGLVTSEFLYREHPTEHEGQLTKTKSLLVSKAILSRRALAMGLGRFVLMSHSEVESGGRQRLSILADAFESVIGAIYLDQGFEAARRFIERWLLRESVAIAADKRHTNYKSHLQEFVQSTYRTHPVYRIRSQMGPDHSKHFHVEVLVGRRTLGSGKGRNKKEAEQAAARDALERVDRRFQTDDEPRPQAVPATVSPEPETLPVVPAAEPPGHRRRGRRGGRGRRGASKTADTETIGTEMIETEMIDREMIETEMAADEELAAGSFEETTAGPESPAPDSEAGTADAPRRRRHPEPMRPVTRVRLHDDDEEEVGRPEGPLEERHVDPYGWSEPIPEHENLSAADAGAPDRGREPGSSPSSRPPGPKASPEARQIYGRRTTRGRRTR